MFISLSVEQSEQERLRLKLQVWDAQIRLLENRVRRRSMVPSSWKKMVRNLRMKWISVKNLVEPLTSIGDTKKWGAARDSVLHICSDLEESCFRTMAALR